MMLGAGVITLLLSCTKTDMNDQSKNPNQETATFAGGCFWCTEAVMEHMTGVLDVKSGYMGGEVDQPTYQQICTGQTGHAEVIQVAFDSEKISYDDLLDVFWQAHDPTTLNQQGQDQGTQYRSAIFYHSAEQKEAAERSKTKKGDVFADSVVTEITAVSTFYEAEGYHQDYYQLNKREPYCRSVIAPKLKKLGLEE
jgi:peptide-methionine (S)-S-oxide reductase